MFPRQALKDILDYCVDSTAMALTYHLFKNNETVDTDSVLADFTESDFGGYAAKSAVDEAEPVNAGAGEVKSLGSELTWTKTGAPETVQQVYGVYVTFVDEDAAVCLFAAWNLPAPVAISVAGNLVKVTVDWYAKDYAP